MVKKVLETDTAITREKKRKRLANLSKKCQVIIDRIEARSIKNSIDKNTLMSLRIEVNAIK